MKPAIDRILQGYQPVGGRRGESSVNHVKQSVAMEAGRNLGCVDVGLELEVLLVRMLPILMRQGHWQVRAGGQRPLSPC